MFEVKIKPLSTNLAWKGKRYKTDSYKQYEADLLYLLPKIKVGKEKLSLTFVVGYSNPQSDIDNFVKQTIDVMQKKYDFNDSQIYELHIYKEIVLKGKEFIKFEIQTIIS